jgi:ceramide glucosyltransferase
VGPNTPSWLTDLGTLLAAVASCYGLTAWVATQWRPRPTRWGSKDSPPVTVLKPLCGAEPALYECLRSLCDQDYPRFQIIFGVRDLHDPAVAVVRALQREFPGCDLKLAIDPRQHGSNRKVSNLINIAPLACYDHLVIADSDVRVPRGYLSRVVAPLLDPGVGIVTCAYRGAPQPGIWSLLGSLFINDWFMPSVRVAALSGSSAFAFGATIAIRRGTLGAVGGFAAIAHQLADDYRLGELTRGMGLRTVLSEVVVETSVSEHNLGDLVRHELRWLRTIRAVRPLGYTLSFVTFSVPLALLGALMAQGAAPTLILLGIATFARMMLHRAGRGPGAAPTALWAVFLNDGLAFALWCWAFTTRRVHWRDDRFRVARDGSVQPIP